MKLQELTTREDEIEVYKCVIGYSKITSTVSNITGIKTSRVLTILKKLKKHCFFKNKKQKNF